MSPKSPVNAVVVRKEEKEAKLQAFVSAHLAACSVPGQGTAATNAMLLVARSVDSPLVKAVKSLAAEIAACGVTVFAILTPDAEAGAAPVASLPPAWTIRCLADVRFRDAHEQLLLGPATSWIGDCMRRDPSKRDAFESYADACPVTADNARKSFWRLWNAAKPVGEIAARGSTDTAAASAVAAAHAENPSDHTNGPSALTRQ